MKLYCYFIEMEKKNRVNEEKKNYIRRIKNGNSFRYEYKNKSPVNDRIILEKIKSIYIAPAYRDVKIFLNSDLLAVGIDSKGRKQYVYSDNFKKKREDKKYCQMIQLSTQIEKLKMQIKRDLAQTEYNKAKLTALLLKIMDLCNFRGGQKNMEKKYKSHGITTLHKKHVEFKNKGVEFDFIGKKGVNNHCLIQDKPIQEIIKKVYRLSTKNDPYLFSIVDPKNSDEKIQVSIQDLNEYLKPYEVTTKDLRTWNANIIFLKNLYSLEDLYLNELKSIKNLTESKEFKLRKRVIKEAVIMTAEALHNTPTVCKNSYIYKSILRDFEEDPEQIKDLFKLTNKSTFEKYLSQLLKRYKKDCKK